MMDLNRIKDLIDLLIATDLSELTLSEGDCRLRLVRRTATVEEHADSSIAPVRAEAVAPAPSDASVGAQDVVAPLHGVLHLTPSPDEPPFVRLGDSIRAGQTLGVLEAMKMFHTLKSDFDGVVAAILAASGSEVEAGQSLFRIT